MANNVPYESIYTQNFGDGATKYTNVALGVRLGSTLGFIIEEVLNSLTEDNERSFLRKVRVNYSISLYLTSTGYYLMVPPITSFVVLAKNSLTETYTNTTNNTVIYDTMDGLIEIIHKPKIVAAWHEQSSERSVYVYNGSFEFNPRKYNGGKDIPGLFCSDEHQDYEGAQSAIYFTAMTGSHELNNIQMVTHVESYIDTKERSLSLADL